MFEFNKDTEWILGRPNFWCGSIAQGLRACGRDIPKHAEEEQAAVIYFLLEMYEKHGENYINECQSWLKKNNKSLNQTDAG